LKKDRLDRAIPLYSGISWWFGLVPHIAGSTWG